MEELIAKVDAAFEGVGKGSQTFVYSLSRMDGSWCFAVVNSWYRWSDAKLQHQFYGFTARQVIQSFLDYIERNNINPRDYAE